MWLPCIQCNLVPVTPRSAGLITLPLASTGTPTPRSHSALPIWIFDRSGLLFFFPGPLLTICTGLTESVQAGFNRTTDINGFSVMLNKQNWKFSLNEATDWRICLGKSHRASGGERKLKQSCFFHSCIRYEGRAPSMKQWRCLQALKHSADEFLLGLHQYSYQCQLSRLTPRWSTPLILIMDTSIPHHHCQLYIYFSYNFCLCSSETCVTRPRSRKNMPRDAVQCTKPTEPHF